MQLDLDTNLTEVLGFVPQPNLHYISFIICHCEGDISPEFLIIIKSTPAEILVSQR